MLATAEEAVAGMSREDGDRICRMVLKLVEHLAAVPTHRKRPHRVGPEPTGVAYAPEMAPWVEQRSDRRMV